MKKIIQLAFFIVTFSIQAQEKDTTDVYFLSLKTHINTWKRFSIDSPNLYKIPTVYFIEQDDYTTNNLPSKINGQKIEILSKNEMLEKTKSGKTFSIISIRPARWANGRLEIHVIDFGVSRKRKKLYFANSGGSSFKIVGNLNGEINVEELENSL